MIDPTTQLFPPLEPYATHQLSVGDGHMLYVEESGNPHGLPALVLHGGPGSSCKPEHRQRFDPAIWRIICFDQRGCGRSIAPPQGPLYANTTPHLVADCDAIRQHLNIATWATLYGSSWGSTLALAYAQAFPHHVRSLMISGIFLADHDALSWFYNPMGLPQFFPNEFSAVQAHAAGVQGHAMIEAIYAKGGDAIKALVFYESMASELTPDATAIQAYVNEAGKGQAGAIKVSYFAQRCYLAEGQLLQNAPTIAHLPIFIQQGLQDMVCPPAGAHRLAQALRAAGGKPTLEIIPACGHRATPAMEAARVAHLAALATQLQA
jgi:proline iminopeptidase